MRIWLPDDESPIVVDTKADGDLTVFEQRFTMVKKPITRPSGFEKEPKEE